MERLRRIVVIVWENEIRIQKGLSRTHVEQLDIFKKLDISKPTLQSL